jgi:predicted outer membrane lipoprotein
MLRALVEEILLFFVPFAAFATWLVVNRRNPFDVDNWSGYKFILTLVGLLLAAAFLIYTGLIAERHMGAYDPPHMENGRLVPGRFSDRP